MTLNPARNLLDHSFYVRWVEGTLTLDELRDYAGQYAHIVRALPGWLRLAGEDGHAGEEDGHLALWHSFAEGLGLSAADLDRVEPNPATAALLDLTAELASAPGGLGAAWAVESQSAPVSRVKLASLAERYGIAGQAAGYFQVHAALDETHTAEIESALAGLTPAELSRAQAASDAVQNGLWDLLSSVERAA